jgi:hypothetical protein
LIAATDTISTPDILKRLYIYFDLINDSYMALMKRAALHVDPTRRTCLGSHFCKRTPY